MYGIQVLIGLYSYILVVPTCALHTESLAVILGMPYPYLSFREFPRSSMWQGVSPPCTAPAVGELLLMATWWF